MNMMYSDYLRDLLSKLSKIHIKFRIIEDTVPPILNRQKWFVIESVLGYEKEFEKVMDDFVWKTLNEEHSLPFLSIKEKQNYLLKRIYFLDFNLPIQKVKERFFVRKPWGEDDKDYKIVLKPFPVKSFPSSEKSDFISHNLLLYNKLNGVPIISISYYFTNISLITKSVLEGHRIPLEVKDDITCIPKESMSFVIKPYAVQYYYANEQNDVDKQKIPIPNEFYYYDGKIEFTYDISIIDNYFLVKLKELIDVLCTVLIKIFKRRDLADFYKKITDELSGKIYIDPTYSSSVMINFSGEEIERKDYLFWKIVTPCIIIIKHFLGEIPEFIKYVYMHEERIEKQKKYLIKTLKIIDEMLSMVE